MGNKTWFLKYRVEDGIVMETTSGLDGALRRYADKNRDGCVVWVEDAETGDRAAASEEAKHELYRNLPTIAGNLIPDSCKIILPGSQPWDWMAELIVMEDGDLFYAPVAEGKFVHPDTYKRTHLILIDKTIARVVPTNRVEYDSGYSNLTYDCTHVPPALHEAIKEWKP